MLGSLSYTIEVITSKLKDGLDEAVKFTQSANKDIEGSIDDVRGVYEDLGQSIKDVTDLGAESSAISDSNRDILASTEELIVAQREREKLIRDEMEDLEELKQRRSAAINVEEVEELNKSIAETEKRIKVLQTANPEKPIKELNEESKKISTDNLSAFESGLSRINPVAGQAVSGLKQMSMASKALQVALGPIGLAIAAIGTAVSALTAYFRKSVEGQQKFAEIMAFLGGVADTVKDIFIDLGRWIVKVFTDPKQAINDLIEILRSQLVNRVKAIVEMVSSGFEVMRKGAEMVGLSVLSIFDKKKRDAAAIAFLEMQEGMRRFHEAAIMAATGVDNLGDKLTSLGKKASGRAKENMALQSRENALQMRQIENMVTIEKLDSEIAALRLKANDQTVNTQEAIEAQTRAMELIEKKYKIQRDLASEELAIQKERMDLGHNSIEDMKKQAELQKALIGLDAQRDVELKALMRRHGALLNQQEMEESARMKAIENERIAREELIQSQIDDRNKILKFIEDSGKTEVELMQQNMEEMLSMHEWTEEEKATITKYWNDEMIKDRKRILADIEQQGLSEIEMVRQQMSTMLDLHKWTEEERSVITQYWSDKIEEIKNRDHDNELARIEMQKEAMSQLGMSIGQALQTGAKNWEEYGRSVVAVIRQIITAQAAQSISTAILSAIKDASKFTVFAIPLLVGAAVGMVNTALNKIPKFAEGGIVPPGYPNDSYPAMLSSGEVVTPPKKLDSVFSGGEVRFRIDGRELVGIMQKTTMKYNLG
jgi:ABC-type transporter Mla subunit MlaD